MKIFLQYLHLALDFFMTENHHFFGSGSNQITALTICCGDLRARVLYDGQKAPGHPTGCGFVLLSEFRLLPKSSGHTNAYEPPGFRYAPSG